MTSGNCQGHPLLLEILHADQLIGHFGLSPVWKLDCSNWGDRRWLCIIWLPYTLMLTPAVKKDHHISCFEIGDHPPSSAYRARDEGISGGFVQLTSVAESVGISSFPPIVQSCRCNFHFNKQASVADPVFTRSFFHYPGHNRNLSPSSNWLCAWQSFGCVKCATGSCLVSSWCLWAECGTTYTRVCGLAFPCPFGPEAPGKKRGGGSNV